MPPAINSFGSRPTGRPDADTGFPASEGNVGGQSFILSKNGVKTLLFASWKQGLGLAMQHRRNMSWE